MNAKRALIAMVAVFVLTAVVSVAPLAAGQDQNATMSPGTYTAKVKAIVCGGCGPLIKQTLEKMKGMSAVKVDQAQKTVQFTVDKGSSLKLSEVQKALKAAADSMGMGADYELLELKPQK